MEMRTLSRECAMRDTGPCLTLYALCKIPARALMVLYDSISNPHGAHGVTQTPAREAHSKLWLHILMHDMACCTAENSS